MQLTKPDLNKPAFRLFRAAAELIKEGRCPMCKAEIKEDGFKDALSKKEYSISGMCQACQDKAFSTDRVEDEANDHEE